MKRTPLKDLCISFLGSKHLFPAELARKIDKQTSSVSRALDSLESDGLVKGQLAQESVNFAKGTVRFSRAYAITDEGKKLRDLIDAEEECK